MKNKGMRAIAIYYLILFMHQGIFSFGSKYMAEVGFSNSQIGVLTSVPYLAGMIFMPVFGAAADRVSKKKYLSFILGMVSAGLLVFLDSFTDWSRGAGALTTKFWPFLIVFTLANIVIQSISPISTSVSLEYTTAQKKPYGPLRMMGSIGYQLGSLLAGFVLVSSLRYTFTLEAAALFASAIIAWGLPDITGHQHGKEKVSPFAILKDRRVLILLLLLLLGSVTSSFYGAFFGVFLNDMGVSNTLTSIIITFSVLMEIPFLLFADRLSKKLTVWQWLMVGFVLNGLRWVGFFFTGQTGSILLLFLCQVPALATLACFEYFPQVYLNRIVPEELSSSVQTDLNVVTFGLSKMIGGLLGGLIADRIGIDRTFLMYGMILLSATVVLIPLFMKLSRREKAQ